MLNKYSFSLLQKTARDRDDLTSSGSLLHDEESATVKDHLWYLWTASCGHEPDCKPGPYSASRVMNECRYIGWCKAMPR